MRTQEFKSICMTMVIIIQTKQMPTEWEKNFTNTSGRDYMQKTNRPT